jgi:predicted patatin/cPLA2 family phospholipase
VRQGFSIAAQGGGMTSAYHAGVIKGIKEKFGFDGLERVVASSGAAAVFTYLISQQDHLIESIWEYLITSGGFVDWRRYPIGKGVMNIDFLVDHVIRERFPLDLLALKNSDIKLDISVTHAMDGSSYFIPKSSELDFYEVLRASCAVPYFYGKKVPLGDHLYCDGVIGSVASLEAIQKEKNVILVLTRPFQKSPKLIILRKILQWLLISDESPELQRAIWNIPSRIDRLPDDILDLRGRCNLAVICPDERLPMFRIDNNLERLRRTIAQGYDDVMASSELDDFFKKL